ncbi:MAG: TrbG/VirB9 family P-type conjugative transfer protein [Burkholderiales bacterium]|nr:TrbG/VirB9 family P-type conjugative transfer protein [Burkholderiales bacterium]
MRASFLTLPILLIIFISAARAGQVVEVPLGHRVEARDSAEIFNSKSEYADTITPHVMEQASKAWASSGKAEILVGDDGEVMYAYGASRPIITCAPLHICVIKLLEGEKITSLSIGDSIRWKVQPTTAGKIPVVVVKPTIVGIATNLVVTTDHGRVYYFTLRSDRKGEYVPEIGFYDPQELIVVVDQEAAQKAEADEKKTAATVATLPGIDPATLDFDYSVNGDYGTVKPVRVFSSAGHTYIQMPENLSYGDAPAIFVVTNNEQQLANFRLVGAYYVIDGIPQEIKLVLGAGDHAKTVTITHKKHTYSLFGG